MQLQLVDENSRPLQPLKPSSGLNLVDESGKSLGNTSDVSVTLDYGAGAPKETTGWLNSAMTFGKNFLESANPIPVALLKSIYQRGNIETAKSVLGAQGEQYVKAQQAFHKGDYLNASRYTLGWLLPLIGPAANEAGDLLGRGEYAAGAGQTLGMGAQPFVLKGVMGLAGRVSTAGRLGVPTELNPVQAETVGFADRQGIPLTVGQRTGNRAALGFETGTSRVPGFAGESARARNAQTAALTRTAENLRQRVEPNLGAQEFTAEQVGTEVPAAIAARAKRFGAQANKAYEQLREIEQRPQNRLDIANTPEAEAARAEEAFNTMVDQSVDARLEAIRDSQRGGATEMTGKTRRSYVDEDNPFDVGAVSGRFGGGFLKSFGLEKVGNTPAEIAAAVERGKGKIYDRVRKVVREQVLDQDSGEIRQALRDVELPPAQAKYVTLPVDMKPVKAAVQPLYDELARRWPIAKQQASEGFRAVENIVNGEDILSASDADANLSALKALQREASDPRSQRIINQAVREMDLAVRGAVTKGGPEAIAALDRGRALTRAKYEALNTGELLERGTLGEPVKIFQKLTGRKDTQVNLLRQVQRQAPDQMPKVGRAFLEGLFDQATKEGGYNKAGTVANAWQALGDESKQIMFKDPGLIEDLDNFFRLSRRLAEGTNPSGTTPTFVGLEATREGFTYFIRNPIKGTVFGISGKLLAKWLYNPRTARALAEGLRVPVSAPGAARVGSIAYLLKLAGEQGRQLDQQAAPAY
jgi:hypothetical protein